MWGYPQHQVLHEKNEPQSFPTHTNYDIYGSYYQQQRKEKRIGLNHVPEVLKNVELDQRKISYRTTGEEYGAFMNLNSHFRPPRWYVVPDSNKVHPSQTAGQYVPESQIPAGLSTKYGHFDMPPSNMLVHQPSYNSRLEYSSDNPFKELRDVQLVQSPPPPPPQEVVKKSDESQSMYKLIQHQPETFQKSNSKQHRSVNQSILPPPPPLIQSDLPQHSAVNQPSSDPYPHHDQLTKHLHSDSTKSQNKLENYEQGSRECGTTSNLPPIFFSSKKICLPDIDSVEFHMKDKSKIVLSVRDFYKGINLL